MDWLKIVVASLMRQIEKLSKKKADRADVERLERELPEGLPEGYTANQQLVTDSDGKTRWEDLPFGDYFELLEIVPPTTVNVEEAEGWDAGFRLGDLSGCNFLLQDNGNGGKKYRVIWDGTPYECVSYGDFAGGRSGIGNSKLFPEIASAGGKGEPFLFYFFYTTSIRAEYPGTHTFAIYEMIDSVRTLDPKYLPAVVVAVSADSDGQLALSDENAARAEAVWQAYKNRTPIPVFLYLHMHVDEIDITETHYCALSAVNCSKVSGEDELVALVFSEITNNPSALAWTVSRQVGGAWTVDRYEAMLPEM